MSVDPLAVATGLVKEIWICVQNVKVYRRRCKNLAWRCSLLINGLMENTAEIDPPTADARHEAEAILLGVRSRVLRWSELNIIKSILARGDISEGVDLLHQKIDTCIAVYHLKINQEVVHGHRLQTLAMERDRIELHETLQTLQEAFREYTRGNPTHARDSLPPDAATEAIQSITEEIDDLQSSTFGDDAFERTLSRFCRSMETLPGLRLPEVTDNMTAFGDHMTRSSSDSQISVNASESLRRSSFRVPFRVPSLLSSFRASSVSLSCPQIPPLDFEDEVTYFRSHTFSFEPSFSPSARSSVLSEPSPTILRHTTTTTLSHDGAAPRPIQHQTSSPLAIALSTPESMWLSSGNPRVIKKATMQGLVQYLLLNPADADQHDTFFIGHPPFVLPQGVLRVLVGRFDEASMCTNDIRDDIRMNVMRLIKNWLANDNVIIADDVLVEIDRFLHAVNGPDSLRARALEVLDLIPEKASLNCSLPPNISSFGSKPDKKPTASQLAVALTTLERRQYLRIRAAEYISHACDLTSHSPNLREALILNERVANLVMSSILHYEDYKGRSNVKRFFLSTAKECRKIRNFSSMCAIVGALQSPAITCLKLTHDTMPRSERQEYQKLTTLLEKNSNYGAYRIAVQRDKTKGCIPWHNVHLDDINIVLQEEETVNSGHELPLINFEKWIHLKEAALDALRYRDLPLECDADGLETAMAWLKWQLQAIPVNDDFSQSLQIKSAKLKQDEDTMGRVHVVGRVGFGDIH